MWLMTPFGFFSTVKKPGDDHLTVRARSASDLDRLRADYLPDLGPTVIGAGTDYPVRAVVGVEAYAEALAAIARDIDYANFKSEVARRMGHGRGHIYSEVWSDLLAIERES